MTEEVNDHDGLGVGVDALFKVGGVHIEETRVYVAESGFGSGQGDGSGGGDKGESGGDDFVFRPQVQGSNRKMEGFCAGPNTHGFIHSLPGGKLFLELLDFRTVDVPRFCPRQAR